MKKYHNKKLNILGSKWTIKRLTGLKDKGILGKCVFREKVIYLDADLKGYELDHTLIHEIGHSIIFRSSIYQSLNYELEEVLVDIYATALLDNFSLK